MPDGKIQLLYNYNNFEIVCLMEKNTNFLDYNFEIVCLMEKYNFYNYNSFYIVGLIEKYNH
jgi:hypothetical protein